MRKVLLLWHINRKSVAGGEKTKQKLYAQYLQQAQRAKSMLNFWKYVWKNDFGCTLTAAYGQRTHRQIYGPKHQLKSCHINRNFPMIFFITEIPHFKVFSWQNIQAQRQIITRLSLRQKKRKEVSVRLQFHLYPGKLVVRLPPKKERKTTFTWFLLPRKAFSHGFMHELCNAYFPVPLSSHMTSPF